MSSGKERHGHSQSDRECFNTELAVLKGFGGDLTSTEDVIEKIGPTCDDSERRANTMARAMWMM